MQLSAGMPVSTYQVEWQAHLGTQRNMAVSCWPASSRWAWVWRLHLSTTDKPKWLASRCLRREEQGPGAGMQSFDAVQRSLRVLQEWIPQQELDPGGQVSP